MRNSPHVHWKCYWLVASWLRMLAYKCCLGPLLSTITVILALKLITKDLWEITWLKKNNSHFFPFSCLWDYFAFKNAWMVSIDNILKHISRNLSSSYMSRSNAVTNSHVELVREVLMSVDGSKVTLVWSDCFLLTSFLIKYPDISLHPVEFAFEIF